MNYNEILAQQQAILNQVMQNSQRVQFWMLVLWLAVFIVGALVIYLFYARLRDITDELRKLRIPYEVAHPPQSRSRSSGDQGSQSAWPAPPKPLGPSAADAKYMPKG